jgi:hypothetical protein
MILPSDIPADNYRRHDPAWPPPPAVREVLRRARPRYHAGRTVDRPSFANPTSYVGLFQAPELLTLARCGYWPLPPPALAWLAERPAKRRRRRRRWEDRVADVVRDVLAEDLAEAVAFVLERMRSSNEEPGQEHSGPDARHEWEPQTARSA